MRKVYIFNSPPRSGKGKSAKHMTKVINNTEGNLSAHHMEFKDELFKITANFLGISLEELLKGYDQKTVDVVTPPLGFEDPTGWYKDYPRFVMVCGEVPEPSKMMSTREMLIHVSENVVKPAFGEDAFGSMFVNTMPDTGLVFCSDGGFPAEVDPLIAEVGAENVNIIRIHRDGCDFSGDSRQYLTADMFDPENCPTFYDVGNNGTLPELFDKVEQIVGNSL